MGGEARRKAACPGAHSGKDLAGLEHDLPHPWAMLPSFLSHLYQNRLHSAVTMQPWNLGQEKGEENNARHPGSAKRGQAKRPAGKQT